MRDSQEKKRSTTPRKRSSAVKSAGIVDSVAEVSSNPLEVVLSDRTSDQWEQSQLPVASLGQKITQIMLNSPNPERVLLEIAQALGESLQVEYCSIAIVANAQNSIQTAYWYPNNTLSPLTQHPSPLLGHLDIPAILANTDPFAIADTRTAKTTLGEVKGCNEYPVRAVLAIKTRFQGHVNGIVAMVHSKPHRWTRSEKERLQAVSDSIAMAISQVQLQRQINASSGHQALLNQLTMAIRSSTELEQIFKLAVDGTARSLEVDRGLILLLKYTEPLLNKSISQNGIPEAKATVVYEWPTGCLSEENQKSTSWLNQSFWLSECQLCQESFMKAPKPIVIPDKYSFPSGDSKIKAIASIFELNTMSALVLVPLESQDNVLGFLVLQQRQPRPWLSEELELVELVSAQISIAILQFQTVRQTSALVKERTAQLESILRVQAKLYETSRQHVEQERHLNQLKDEFIDTMSDQLRNPLASMKMAILMLRQPGLNVERQAKYLDILEQQCTQEINLINDLLDIRRLESNKPPLQLQNIDLKQIIQGLGEDFAQKWGAKGLNLIMDLPHRSVMIQSDHDSLDRILAELLTNAGKYSDPDTTVYLNVIQKIEKEIIPQIIVTITNTGPGISPIEQKYIFDKFRRGHGVSEQVIQGTGLGLALVKCLVQHLNGTIDVSSNPTSNDSESWLTCFTLCLPQRQF